MMDAVRPHPPVTSAQAAQLLNVPPARVARWVSDGLVHPRGLIRGRGRGGRVPTFDLDDFRALADRYHARAASRTDDTPASPCIPGDDQRQ